MKQTLELKLKRNFKKPEWTVGELYINGEWFSETLEDTVRILGKKGEGKIYGETAIPEGRYRILMQYSSKFKRKMPYLQDVPHFSGIMIHPGNTPTDTLGCILVGENKKVGQLINSRSYSDRLNAVIEEAINDKKEVWITVE